MNNDIKNLIKDKGIYMWEVASKIGCNDGNFSRKLRKELSIEDKKKIIDAINEIVNEKGGVKHESKNFA